MGLNWERTRGAWAESTSWWQAKEGVERIRPWWKGYLRESFLLLACRFLSFGTSFQECREMISTSLIMLCCSHAQGNNNAKRFQCSWEGCSATYSRQRDRDAHRMTKHQVELSERFVYLPPSLMPKFPALICSLLSSIPLSVLNVHRKVVSNPFMPQIYFNFIWALSLVEDSPFFFLLP